MSVDADLEGRIDLLPPPELCFPVIVERTLRYVVMVEAESASDAVDMVKECAYEYVGEAENPIDGYDSVEPIGRYDLEAYLGDRIGPLDSCRECRGPAADLNSLHVNHAVTCSEYTHYLNLDKVYDRYPEIKGWVARCSCRVGDMDGKQLQPDQDSAVALIEAHADGKKEVHRGMGIGARAARTVPTGGVL